jgi:hypothetical protein
MGTDASVPNNELLHETAGATMNRKPGIDHSLVYDGLLFATHRDRCRYIGKSGAEKARWREQNKGKFQRIEDVQQEPQLGPPAHIGAAPTGLDWGTSSPDIRNDGDDDSTISLVGHCSPPYRPASLPKENLPSGPAHTELLPSPEATTRETKVPKTQTPVVDPGHKGGRSGSRQLEKQKVPERNSKAGRKRSHKRMRIVLGALKEYPILARAAEKAGIHRKTLAYWLKRSEAGDDGYDIEWQGVQWRFHEHCKSAIEEAHDMLLGLVWHMAMGVTFKIDPVLVALGCEGDDAYARDQNGNFIEETTGQPNLKMIRFCLEWMRPEKWGKHPKSDITETGGVLVIGERTQESEDCYAASIKARKWKSVSRNVRGLRA